MPELGTQTEQDAEEQEWLVIPPEENIPRNIRFRSATRRVIKLLRLRKIWSKAGRWLQLPTSRQQRYVSTRRIISHIFESWPTTVLRGFKAIFAHLERVNGRLVYRAQ